MIIRVMLWLSGTCRRCGWQTTAPNAEALQQRARDHGISEVGGCVARASEIDSSVITECIPQPPVTCEGLDEWVDTTLGRINQAIVMSHQVPLPILGSRATWS